MKFVVCLEVRNIKLSGSAKKASGEIVASARSLGCFGTRIIEASDEASAIRGAKIRILDDLKKDGFTKSMINDESDPLLYKVDYVIIVENEDVSSIPKGGFTFYPEE